MKIGFTTKIQRKYSFNTYFLKKLNFRDFSETFGIGINIFKYKTFAVKYF